MYIINIFRRENRRSGKDRRKADDAVLGEHERRKSPDRRSETDIARDIGRKSGIYYKLSDRRKDTVDSIIDILEYENLKRK